MFTLLGILVAAYAIHAAYAGEVYARSGIGGRRISREREPTYFGAVIVIYAGLGIAMITLF